MEVFREIRSALAEGSIPLVPALQRLCSSGLLREMPFFHAWLDSELNGYSPETGNIPAYRYFQPEVYASYTFPWGSEDRKLDMEKLPAMFRGDIPIFQSLVSLEYTSRGQDPRIHFIVPEKKFRILKEQIEYGEHCTSAWSFLDEKEIGLIISAVRRILGEFLKVLPAEGPDFAQEADRLFRIILNEQSTITS